jgi:hypothetical protein
LRSYLPRGGIGSAWTHLLAAENNCDRLWDAVRTMKVTG